MRHLGLDSRTSVLDLSQWKYAQVYDMLFCNCNSAMTPDALFTPDNQTTHILAHGKTRPEYSNQVNTENRYGIDST